MLDNILSIVKDVALDTVNKSADVPSDKKDLVVKTATDAISSGLTSNAANLAGLFSGKSGSNSIMDSIQESVVSSLMKKVGLNSGVASSLVAAMLPTIISTLTSKMGSGGEGGFNLESVLGALGGGDKKKGGLGDALGAFGKLFG